jgi:hypothetical protein
MVDGRYLQLADDGRRLFLISRFDHWNEWDGGSARERLNGPARHRR